MIAGFPVMIWLQMGGSRILRCAVLVPKDGPKAQEKWTLSLRSMFARADEKAASAPTARDKSRRYF